MDATEIETWAMANPKKAVQLGRDVYAISTGETPPSRGKTQDEMIAWARQNPMKAKMLFLRLMPKLARYAD
jgi:hypothetical protein